MLLATHKPHLITTHRLLLYGFHTTAYDAGLVPDCKATNPVWFSTGNDSDRHGNLRHSLGLALLGEIAEIQAVSLRTNMNYIAFLITTALS